MVHKVEASPFVATYCTQKGATKRINGLLLCTLRLSDIRTMRLNARKWHSWRSCPICFLQWPFGSHHRVALTLLALNIFWSYFRLTCVLAIVQGSIMRCSSRRIFAISVTFSDCFLIGNGIRGCPHVQCVGRRLLIATCGIDRGQDSLFVRRYSCGDASAFR